MERQPCPYPSTIRWCIEKGQTFGPSFPSSFLFLAFAPGALDLFSLFLLRVVVELAWMSQSAMMAVGYIDVVGGIGRCHHLPHNEAKGNIAVHCTFLYMYVQADLTHPTTVSVVSKSALT